MKRVFHNKMPRKNKAMDKNSLGKGNKRHWQKKENTKQRILARVIELGEASRVQLDSRSERGIASPVTLAKRLPELVRKGYLARFKREKAFVYKPTVRAKLRVYRARELLKKQGLEKQEVKRLVEVLGDLEESDERNARLWIERIKQKLKQEGMQGIPRLVSEAKIEKAEESIAKHARKTRREIPFSQLTRKIYGIVYGSGGGTVASISRRTNESPKRVESELQALEKAGKIRSVQIGEVKIYQPPKGMLVMGKKHRKTQNKEIPKVLGARARAEFEEKKQRLEKSREAHGPRLPQAEIETRIATVQEIREIRRDVSVLMERLSPQQPLPAGILNTLKKARETIVKNKGNRKRIKALDEVIERFGYRKFPALRDISSIRSARAELGVIANKTIRSLVKAGVSPAKWEKS